MQAAVNFSKYMEPVTNGEGMQKYVMKDLFMHSYITENSLWLHKCFADRNCYTVYLHVTNYKVLQMFVVIIRAVPDLLFSNPARARFRSRILLDLE